MTYNINFYRRDAEKNSNPDKPKPKGVSRSRKGRKGFKLISCLSLRAQRLGVAVAIARNFLAILGRI
jgi:hypothetical protein